MSTIKLREVNAIGATPKEFEIEGNTPGGGIKTLSFDLTNANGILYKSDHNYSFEIELNETDGELIKELGKEDFSVIIVTEFPSVDKIDFSGDTSGTGRIIYENIVLQFKNMRFTPIMKPIIDGVLFPSTYLGLSKNIPGSGGSINCSIGFNGVEGPHHERLVGPAVLTFEVNGLEM